MTDLVPIDDLVVSVELSGASGRNRSSGRAQILAEDDRSAVLAWLARYSDSPATLASYRKEAERLMLWCVFERRRALSDLAHEDLLLFQQFLKNPQPASRWVMANGHKPSRTSPEWRPFAGPLAPSSERQALSIINGMFNWLVEAGYLAGNPLALRRRVRHGQAAPRQLGRFLPDAHWDAVRTTVKSMPTSSPREVATAARARWIFSLLYLGGMRVTELATGKMAAFHHLIGADGKARWWLEVFGKGSKVRLVPATDELIAEMRQYRSVNGLADLPRPGDDLPLILPLIGPPVHMTRSGLYEVVKGIVRATAERIRALGPEHAAAADHIERASPHWMRHTAGTALARKMSLASTRDNLGHSNIQTTSIYVHSEDDARHDETNAAHRISW